MKTLWFAGAIASLGAALVFACSSSNNNGGGAAACLASSGETTQACLSCVENSCSSQLNTYNSACSAFISCACPGGTYSATAAENQSCEANLTTGTCETAAQAVGNCVTQSCNSQCNNTSSSSGGSSSSGSSSGSSSLTCATANLTGDCLNYCNCCASSASTSSSTQTQCATAAQDVQSAGASECTLAYAAEQDAGLCH